MKLENCLALLESLEKEKVQNTLQEPVTVQYAIRNNGEKLNKNELVHSLRMIKVGRVSTSYLLNCKFEVTGQFSKERRIISPSYLLETGHKRICNNKKRTKK